MKQETKDYFKQNVKIKTEGSNIILMYDLFWFYIIYRYNNDQDVNKIV